MHSVIGELCFPIHTHRPAWVCVWRQVIVSRSVSHSRATRLQCMLSLFTHTHILAHTHTHTHIHTHTHTHNSLTHTGHYISAQLDPSIAQSQVVAVYSAAAYVCGYSFSYQLHGDGELVLQSSSGNVVWSSGTEEQQWVHVNMSNADPQILTRNLSDGLQFSLVSHGGGDMPRAFLDEVVLVTQLKTERSPLSIFCQHWCCDILADLVEDEVSCMGARV